MGFLLHPGITRHLNMKFLMVVTMTMATSAANLPTKPIPALPLKDQVGVGRIVGGEEATDGEFPWQVSLRSVGALGATHFCGGSIIDKDWIMTAGHCCAGQLPLTMHVVAGGIKLNNLENDVCLLKLKESLEWTEFVQPIALPEAGQVTEAGTDRVITGWGTLTEGGFGLPNVLHKVTVPVVSDEDCNAAYSASGYTVADSMICAGLEEGGKDSCQGDSGGPMITGEAGSEMVVGVVSWGIGCARKGYPGVYTEVAYFVDWIMETMAAYA